MNGYSIYMYVIVDRQRVTMSRPLRTVIISRRSHLRQTIGLNELGVRRTQSRRLIQAKLRGNLRVNYLQYIHVSEVDLLQLIQYDTLSYMKQPELFRRYSYQLETDTYTKRKRFQTQPTNSEEPSQLLLPILQRYNVTRSEEIIVVTSTSPPSYL